MESDLSYLFVLLICFVLSAFFAGAETALTTVPEASIRKYIEERSGFFIKPLKLWLNKPNGVLTTIIVGNNLVNTLAAVTATVFAQRIFDEYVISIATGLTTLALLVFGEITPKTFARHNAHKLIRWMMSAIYPVYFMLFPITWILSYLATTFVKIFGGSIKRMGPLASEEDIAYLIRMSHEEGVFKKEHGKMLQSVISFRDLSVREVMVPRTNLCALDLETDIKEVMSEVAQYGYTRWPVFKDNVDQIEGILYVKDLINFQFRGFGEFVLSKHLRKAIFVPEAMKLDAVLKKFQKQKVHMAIVVDEYGGTAGIITLEDILEEIVGEIRDEYDKEEEERLVTKIAEDHYLALARVSISDLKKLCGIELPADEAFDTLGGFLVNELGKIPKKGEVVRFKEWEFCISDVEEKRIIKVDIKKTKDHDPLSTSP